ncbi:MAG: type III-B CRISPR module-associated protein Cmr3 [Syntrophus sp. (in: bacteria)]|nr:type III-B CRISPR module-associated protein Cmr3 [Syntrophus sp. (in: bacteria)]
MTTYRVTPNDTLFFRGGEPMGMGESHFQTSVFPPSPETFIGAVRTSVIVHKGDGDFEGYKNGKYNDASWFKEIGFKELPDTFQFTGPFMIKEKDILLPPPCNLFTDADKDAEKKSFAIASPRDFQKITHSSAIPEIMWIHRSGGATGKNWKPVQGYITLDGMKKYLKGSIDKLSAETDFMANNTLFETESRTGIALEKNGLRTALSGHLYMTSHIRFAETVGMIFILEGVPSLPDSLTMRLGGENRTAWCEKSTDAGIPSFQENVEFLVTTMPTKTKKVEHGIPVTEFLDEDMNIILPGGVKSKLISYAVNKPELFGGWDLAAQKSKAMTQYVPAGSVFYFDKCDVKGRNNKYLLGGNDVH